MFSIVTGAFASLVQETSLALLGGGAQRAHEPATSSASRSVSTNDEVGADPPKTSGKKKKRKRVRLAAALSFAPAPHDRIDRNASPTSAACEQEEPQDDEEAKRAAEANATQETEPAKGDATANTLRQQVTQLRKAATQGTKDKEAAQTSKKKANDALAAQKQAQKSKEEADKALDAAEQQLEAEKSRYAKLTEDAAALRKDVDSATQDGKSEYAKVVALQKQVDTLTDEKTSLENTSRAHQREAQLQVAALEKEVARLKRDKEVKATHEELSPETDKNASTAEVRRNVDSFDRIRIVPVALATYSRMDAAHPGLLWQHVYRAHPRRRARRQGHL